MSTPKSFTMNIYTRRWQHDDCYSIEMTPTGWNVTQGIVGGGGDKTGFPGLKQCFEQDYVSYPANIGNYFEKIWEMIDSKAISDAKAQEHFNALGLWISTCEKATPSYIYS